ncbi:MAG TPA: glycoside hydrolase family 15 protein [Stellaceae bacterium]|nr:glycoside hydrolase family 15 protein [Stellaceae bacterium]
MTEIDAWLEAQTRASARGIAACMSRTDLVKYRAGFGGTVTPVPGSILASPSTAYGPGEPDYFFHWTRDAALVMNAVPALVRADDRSADWPRLFREWVAFEAALGRLDGSRIDAGDRTGVQPDFVRFLRPAEELAALHGEAVAGDVRFNPDGTLDTIRWSRPQHDGAALRALVIRRCLAAGLEAPEAASLIETDLDYTEAHAGAECVDVWEESSAAHYDTVLVQYAALQAGRRHAAAERLARALDAYWSNTDGALRCALPPESRKTLDMAVILGVLHAGLERGPHSVHDGRVQATLAALERHFAAAFPINRGSSKGILCGRYPGDRYVTGGPWYITSLAAAEFRYRRAAAGNAATRHLVAEADALLTAIRRTTPPSGALSEQIDPEAGTQASARDLGWSHAAFLTAAAARRAALG